MFAEWESSELFPSRLSHITRNYFMLSSPVFFSVDIITLAIVWATGVSDCWVWLLGLLLGKQWILFDLIFLLQRDASRGFSSDHNCPLSGSEMICPHETNKQTNKQITANDLCVWEKHMAAHVSVSVFFPHCLSLLISLPVHVCVCVCIRLGTDLSSSWQTPSTATAGPQPVDAERPKLQERSRGPKIFPWPLKALLIFTVSCF